MAAEASNIAQAASKWVGCYLPSKYPLRRTEKPLEPFSHLTRYPFYHYLVDIDTSFFTLFRQMFKQGTVAKIGVYAWAVYTCI
jgi:hypothetical protein